MRGVSKDGREVSAVTASGLAHGSRRGQAGRSLTMRNTSLGVHREVPPKNTCAGLGVGHHP